MKLITRRSFFGQCGMIVPAATFPRELAAGSGDQAPAVTDDVWRFEFKGPLPRWKDGLPVGNGRIGAQCWGTGPQLFLTLDRSDVWDLRYQPNPSTDFTYARLRELVRSRQTNQWQNEMTADVSPTADVTPFHLSAGRLRINLPENTQVERAELDMRQAEVRWSLLLGSKPVTFRVIACTNENVIIATLEGIADWEPVVRHESLTEIGMESSDTLWTKEKDLSIQKLGYQKPVRGEDGNIAWTIQAIPESGRFAVVWKVDRQPGRWQIILTISSQNDPDPIAVARQTLQAAERADISQLRAQHQAWWEQRWARASVHLPEKELERLWINGIYKLASSSSLSVPANLQGLWPPEGEFPPPWRGDYHFNTNVQEAYGPAYSANQLDLAEPLNKWLLEEVAPRAETLTHHFFGVQGLFMGGAYDIKGRLLGKNWPTVQFWLGGGGWMAQHLWWYYRYSLDEDFLRRRAYSFLSKCLQFYENILEKGADSYLHVPLSTSPEYFGNEPNAWTPDPTGDVAIIRNLARYAIMAAEVLKLGEPERSRWKALEQSLTPYPVSKSTGLKVQPDSDYVNSHAIPMQLFPIFPGEDLNVEGSAADRELIDRSLENWIFCGMGGFLGHSYPKCARIAARLRRGNHAWNLLKIYARAFIWPNGFHANGDYRRLGFSYATYQPFTMEAECEFTAAVNEMLLQSWGGKLRIFPAVPEFWPDVSFENLRAEGALLVSAERRAGKVTRLSILSEKGGPVRLVWPLGPLAANQKFEERVLNFGPSERKDIRVP